MCGRQGAPRNVEVEVLRATTVPQAAIALRKPVGLDNEQYIIRNNEEAFAYTAVHDKE